METAMVAAERVGAETEAAALVTVLCQEQARRVLTDGQFAALLGVSREQWRKLRTGKARAGHRTLRGVREAFPQFSRLVEDYLASRNVRILTLSERIGATRRR